MVNPEYQEKRQHLGALRFSEDRPAEPAKAAQGKKPSILKRALERKLDYGEWIAAQIFLVVAGLLAALIVLALVPRTATLAVAAIDAEPARAAIVGILGLAVLGIISVINGILFGTVIWIPFGTILAVASTVTVLLSALLGIAFFGGALQTRRPTVRSFFSRAFYGLMTIAVLNCIPGLGPASFALQVIALALGLGGLIITGFGRDPDWLSRRLSSASRSWHD
jgi:hypothetical protein